MRNAQHSAEINVESCASCLSAVGEGFERERRMFGLQFCFSLIWEFSHRLFKLLIPPLFSHTNILLSKRRRHNAFFDTNVCRPVWGLVLRCRVDCQVGAQGFIVGYCLRKVEGEVWIFFDYRSLQVNSAPEIVHCIWPVEWPRCLVLTFSINHLIWRHFFSPSNSS